MSMPFAGGLDHHQREIDAPEPTLELADPFASVGHAQPFVRGQHVDIKPIFADVDSHARLRLGLLFGRFLALHAGRAPYHLLRTRAEGRTDHAHPRCQSPRGFSGPGHPRRGWWPPSPTHLSACADSVFRPCKGVTIYRETRTPSPHPFPLRGEGADRVCRTRPTPPSRVCGSLRSGRDRTRTPAAARRCARRTPACAAPACS